MQVELKNIKHARSLSEETNAFTADLWVEGEKVGYAKNNGRGEQTHIAPFEGNRDKLREAEEWAASLPSEIVELGDGPIELKSRLDTIVDKLVEDDLVVKDLQKEFRRGVVVQNEDGSMGVYPYKKGMAAADKKRMQEMVRQKKGKTVLNDLPKEDLLAKTMREPAASQEQSEGGGVRI
jgi:hypothetical protein